MYAEFGGLTFYMFFVIKYSNICFVGICYKEIKHKYGFGQAYYKYLLKRILNKFISYFYKILFYFLQFFEA
jgi:hypothetical protein